MTTAAPARKRLSRADRQAQILQAAREVFLESGLSGTRTREIALRAGITEAYLYRHFKSKDDLYSLAVEAPLERLVVTLHDEIETLKATEGIRRDQLLERANLVFLQAMKEITPLLTVAMFSELSKGKTFYRKTIRPRLQQAFESIIVDVSGWDPPRVDHDVAILGFFGVHYGLCLDYMLCERKLDVAMVAKQITDVFSGGIREIGDPAPKPAKGTARTRAVAARAAKAAAKPGTSTATKAPAKKAPAKKASRGSR
jgi:AcrR family transcriptional regulator